MAIETVMKQEEEKEEFKRPLTRKEAWDMAREKLSHESYIELRWLMLAANCIYYNPNNNKGA